MNEQQLIERVRVLRQRSGFTQTELAKRLSISRSALAQIELGQRKVSAIELIGLSHIFGISCEELLDSEKEPTVLIERSAELSASASPLRISVPQKNLQKFRAVLLYILNEVGSNPNIGETVLYKLLYFMDFDYYEKYEEQFIGATYIKNHYGPTPVEFKKIIEAMIEEGKIIKVRSQYFKHPQTKYLPVERADLSVLNGRELEMIEDVLGRLSEMNATQISNYSHGDVPWISAEIGETIDYETVFYRTGQYSVRGEEPEEE